MNILRALPLEIKKLTYEYYVAKWLRENHAEFYMEWNFSFLRCKQQLRVNTIQIRKYLDFAREHSSDSRIIKFKLGSEYFWDLEDH